MYIQNLESNNKNLQIERDELINKINELQQKSIGFEQKNKILIHELQDV